MGSDKISTSLVECERVKAKIGKALRADGSPCVWKKFPPRADKRVSSPKHFRWAPICTTIWYWSSYRRGKIELPREIANKNNFGFQFLCFSNLFLAER